MEFSFKQCNHPEILIHFENIPVTKYSTFIQDLLKIDKKERGKPKITEATSFRYFRIRGNHFERMMTIYVLTFGLGKKKKKKIKNKKEEKKIKIHEKERTTESKQQITQANYRIYRFVLVIDTSIKTFLESSAFHPRNADNHATGHHQVLNISKSRTSPVQISIPPATGNSRTRYTCTFYIKYAMCASSNCFEI